MSIVFYIIAGILGMMTGSFLNVVAMRGDERASVGVSRCPHCSHRLAWYELVPIVSYFALRGHCRHCRVGISLRYPLIEIVSAVAFITVFSIVHDPILAFGVIMLVMLSLLSSAVDIDHFVLPSRYLNPMMLVAFMLGLYTTGGYFSAIIVMIMGIIVVAGPLYGLYALSGGRWIGFGDVRLGVFMGILLGPAFGFAALIFAFWIGALCAIALMIAQRLWKGTLTMKSMIPFGPFLMLATWLIYFVNLDILDVIVWMSHL